MSDISVRLVLSFVRMFSWPPLSVWSPLLCTNGRRAPSPSWWLHAWGTSSWAHDWTRSPVDLMRTEANYKLALDNNPHLVRNIQNIPFSCSSFWIVHNQMPVSLLKIRKLVNQSMLIGWLSFGLDSPAMIYTQLFRWHSVANTNWRDKYQWIREWERIYMQQTGLWWSLKVTLTIIFVNAIFLVYVVSVLSTGSHMDSSTIFTDFALLKRWPQLGILFVFDSNRLEYNFPSRIDRSMVSSVNTWVLQNMQDKTETKQTIKIRNE